jgi:PAS domain S-box-containing protein
MQLPLSISDDVDVNLQAETSIDASSDLWVELAELATWRFDLHTGRLDCNPRAAKLLGLPSGTLSLAEADLRTLVHADDLPRVLKSLHAHHTGTHPVDLEARLRQPDGTWRLVLTRRVARRNSQGRVTGCAGVAWDVTDRVHQARRTEDLLHRFELAVRSTGIGHWVFEPATGQSRWSEELRQMFGLAAAEPAPGFKQAILRFVHPDERDPARERLDQWLRCGAESLVLPLRILRSDGQERQVLTHSRVESGSTTPSLFGIVIDLTDRHAAEFALNSAAERADLAEHGAGLATWEHDLDSGAMRWDAHMWTLRGHAPQRRAMTQAERLASIHPEDRAYLHQVMKQALATGAPVEHEFRVVWPDGQVRWLASRSRELRDGHSGRRRRIGMNWDVTDKRTAEAVRREREMAQLESRAKSKFLARMSHELRTPLNAVLGFSQLLLAEEAGSEPASASRRRRLEHIQLAGKHLLTLINDVLELSSLEGGERRLALEPVALAPLVQDTLALLTPLRDAHGVSIIAGALDVQVMADRTRLRQVLLNLMSNAVKYNHEGGEVRVQAQAADGVVLISVADTGMGMSESQLPHLFEPFNRLGRAGGSAAIEGTGIGLAIVKALVEHMGGAVHVRSTVGAGSVFEVRLTQAPAAAAAPSTVAAPAHGPNTFEALPTSATQPGLCPSQPAPEASAEASQVRPEQQACRVRQVLYIEDNPINAMIIRELFGLRDDLELCVATDGASGVARAAALQPDLILLDMQLPDIDGFEVLRRLRAQPATACIPCVAVSANAMPGDIQRALRAGLAAYWTKPLDFNLFLSSLDQVLIASSAPAPH